MFPEVNKQGNVHRKQNVSATMFPRLLRTFNLTHKVKPDVLLRATLQSCDAMLTSKLLEANCNRFDKLPVDRYCSFQCSLQN